MTVGIVITIYKDLEALDLIVEAIKNQTVKPNEIIIAEDNNSDEVAKFVANIKIDNVLVYHTFQEDNGWQRNKSTNNALRVAKSDYLIWIDGDCIPYPTLVESHIALCENNTVLCGRRAEPGEKFSTALRKKQISVDAFLKNYIKNFFKLKRDNIKHYEDGFSLKADSFLFKIINLIRKNKENHIVGCHWSAWKKDLEKINGFDEDFTLPTTGEDTDIERRLRYFGIKMKSCRYCANVIHLYHKKVFNPDITSKTEKLMKTKKDQFICKNGLNKI
jgi:glycosyltransferase involved in cell wall biosynthesis